MNKQEATAPAGDGWAAMERVKSELLRLHRSCILNGAAERAEMHAAALRFINRELAARPAATTANDKLRRQAAEVLNRASEVTCYGATYTTVPPVQLERLRDALAAGEPETPAARPAKEPAQPVILKACMARDGLSVCGNTMPCAEHAAPEPGLTIAEQAEQLAQVRARCVDWIAKSARQTIEIRKLLAAKAALRGQLKKEREQHGQQVASSASPTRSSQGSRVGVPPRGQDQPEEGRPRVVGQPTDAAGVRRSEPGVVDEPPWHRSDPAGAPAIERANHPADSVQERDADRPSGDRSDSRDGSGLTIAETERHMAALCDETLSAEDAEVDRWRDTAGCDPIDSLDGGGFRVYQAEIDAAVRIMRERGAALREMTRERDAYRKAKAENDERFMIERDEARERAEKAEAERDRHARACATAVEALAKAEWERDEAKREIKSDMENYKARWTRCEPYLDDSTHTKSWDEIICMFADRAKTAEAEVARLTKAAKTMSCTRTVEDWTALRELCRRALEGK